VNWLWLNIPLMAVFFLAMTGIPMWMVFRHPDTGPGTGQVAATRQPRGQAERELAGAWR
jgi:hypothetical protein